MEQQSRVLDVVLSPKQSEAFNFLESPDIDEVTFGGAKGGAKTVLGVKWTFYKLKQLIQFWDLPRNVNPIVAGFIGRKQAIDFTTTTLNTWKRDIPAEAYEIKEQKKLIVIDKRIALQFGGLDDQDTIKKFNSAEYAFVWVDQAEECSENDVGMLRGTLRLKVKNLIPAYKALWTCNPPINDDPSFKWIKRDFVDSPQPRFKFVKSLWKDNPFLPKNYGDQLTRAFGFNPDLLAAYRDGNFEKVTSANVIIPSSIVKENVNNPILKTDPFIRRVTVCDIAGGDDDGSNEEDIDNNDETVIYDLENTEIVKQEIYSHRDEMDTCGRIVAHQKKNRSTVVCIDRVGLGSAVFARLKEIYQQDIVDGKIAVYGFDSRVSAPIGIEGDETYANYKAYAWFNASKNYFRERKCYLPDDPVLTSQLSAVTFYYKSGGMLAVTPKKKIKARLGHSPDRADAYVMGLDALKYAKTGLVRKDSETGWSGGSFVPEPVYA